MINIHVLVYQLFLLENPILQDLEMKNPGAEAEKLVYDISVTNQNSLFIYKYAVVVEDAGHDYYDQPGFSVRIIR